jgi:hypothetical protein
MNCADRDHAPYPRRTRIYRISNTGFLVIARPNALGFGGDLDQNATWEQTCRWSLDAPSLRY